MATEQELYSFENSLHGGFIAQLGRAGLPVTWPDLSRGAVPDEYIVVKVDGFAETGHYGYNGAGDPIPDQWTCQVSVSVLSKRLDKALYGGSLIIPDSHASMRAKVREALQIGRASADSLNTYITNHEVEMLTLSGTSHSFDSDSGTDISVLTYDMTFAIEPANWPA